VQRSPARLVQGARQEVDQPEFPQFTYFHKTDYTSWTRWSQQIGSDIRRIGLEYGGGI